MNSELASGHGAPGLRGSTARGVHENPFIAMSAAARLAILLYFVFWRILPELPAALQFDTLAWDVVAARFFARVLLEILLLLPFLLYRFAGTPIGWLHPLVLPALLTIAKDVVTTPHTLLTAITAWQTAPVIPEYRLMAGMPLEVLLSAELKRDALTVLAQIALLLGFSIYSRRARLIADELPIGVSPMRMLLVLGACFAVLIYFIRENGGLVQHFSELAKGRFLTGKSDGHFLVIIALTPYLMVLWYLARPQTLQQPWFSLLFLASTLAQFLTTGSRSSLINPMILLLAAWMLVNGKIPALRVVLLGMFIASSLGVFGDLRSSAARNQGVVDFSVLEQIDFLSGVQRTIDHRAKNEEVSGKIAVMHAVPHRVPHLYGSTYISAAAFFIPRSIWPDKPRGPGAHVGAIIYSGMSSTTEYTGAGFPPGGVGEAYWNFGVPGVTLVYFLFGLFLRLITNMFLQRPRSPWPVMVFLMTMLILGSPNTDAIVSFLQALVLLMASWLFVREVPKRTARSGAPLHSMSVDGGSHVELDRAGWARR